MRRGNRCTRCPRSGTRAGARPRGPGPLPRTGPEGHCQGPPGARVESHPDPPHVARGSHGTPHLVGFDHDRAGLFGGAPGSCGVRSRYRVLTNPWTQDRDRPVIRAMARTPTRSLSSRRTKSLVTSGTGPVFGAATNRRSHPRHRNPGVLEWVRPLRTTWDAPHRGHGGTGDREGVEAGISTTYDDPDSWATTPVSVVTVRKLE